MLSKGAHLGIVSLESVKSDCINLKKVAHAQCSVDSIETSGAHYNQDFWPKGKALISLDTNACLDTTNFEK